MKRYGFIILATLFFWFVCLPLQGGSIDPQADAWAEYNKQAREEERLKVEAWEKYHKDQDEEAQRKKKYWEQYQKEQDEEAQRKNKAWETFEKQLTKDSELQSRYEKLIIRWEEQAMRFDNVLDAMEKQAGVENDQ